MEGTLQEKLFKNKESGWKSIDEEETKKVFELSKKYIDFLNIAKTSTYTFLLVKFGAGEQND